MAEVHIIGEVCYAKDFAKNYLFCKWELEIGKYVELFTLVVEKYIVYSGDNYISENIY